VGKRRRFAARLPVEVTVVLRDVIEFVLCSHCAGELTLGRPT
jgi:hypothetical protein